jgi:hypothetical protein
VHLLVFGVDGPHLLVHGLALGDSFHTIDEFLNLGLLLHGSIKLVSVVGHAL